MTQEEHKRAGDLFDRIRGLPAVDQAAALDEACGDDAGLRAQVARLLKADRNACGEKFLSRPALEDAAGILVADRVEWPADGAIIGNYRLNRRIGAGGMGVVYEAEDLRLSRRVAVKVLPSAYSEERILRFQREARAAAQLNHPHIAAIYDAGLDHGFHYIAMELVSGHTLREMIAGRRGLSDSTQILELLAQAASALSAAHTVGIIHRDIKPENIMVRTDGFAKVLDFGLASAHETTVGDDQQQALKTRPGQLAGTVHYFSPEQILGKPATPQSDLFSLGVVAYEMATGARPFTGPTDGAVFDAILHANAPAPSLLRPTLGREFDDLIQHALEKDPELRYQTASDFRSSCLRLSRHTSSNFNTVLPPSPKIRPNRLRIGILSGAVLAIVVVGVSVLWWLLRFSAMPYVTRVVQITRYRAPVTHFVIDGGRIYFSTSPQNGAAKMLQVGADGGEPIALPEWDGMLPQDVSPDRSQILLAQVNGKSPYGRFPLWIASPVAGPPRRLADLEGQFARWSPKGDRIAFSQEGSLRMASVDGAESREIARVNGYIEDGAWSPDGQRLRFAVSLPNSRHIWEVGVNGSGLHPVSFRGWSEPWAETGAWTPDGKYFLFSAGQFAHDLWICRDGVFKKPVRLTHGPLWDLLPWSSSNGKRIYFIGFSNIAELIRFDARSGQWLPFLDGMDAVQLDYSADLKSIAYVDSKGSLWRSAANGSERKQLTGPPLYARNPRWSHDGNNIVFHAGPVGQPDSIYIWSAATGSVTRLTHGENGTGEGDGNWSPHSRLILFSSPSNENDKKPYLYILNLQNLKIERLPHSARLWSPRWSPDGKTIVALDEKARLNLYDMTTHRTALLTANAAAFPIWSRDGKYVYFENNLSTAWFRFRLDDRHIDSLQKLPALETALNSSGWVGMTPDGTVISARAVNSSNIYALDLDSD